MAIVLICSMSGATQVSLVVFVAECFRSVLLTMMLRFPRVLQSSPMAV